MWTLLFWGVLGFVLIKLDIPLTPIIMGYILGPITEKYLRRGLMMSRNNFMDFFNHRVAAIFLILTVLLVTVTFVTQVVALVKSSKKKKDA